MVGSCLGKCLCAQYTAENLSHVNFLLYFRSPSVVALFSSSLTFAIQGICFLKGGWKWTNDWERTKTACLGKTSQAAKERRKESHIAENSIERERGRSRDRFLWPKRFVSNRRRIRNKVFFMAFALLCLFLHFRSTFLVFYSQFRRCLLWAFIIVTCRVKVCDLFTRAAKRTITTTKLFFSSMLCRAREWKWLDYDF